MTQINILWTAFLTGIVVALLVYYAIMLLLFYRKKLNDWSRSKLRHSSNMEDEEETVIEHTATEESDAAFEQVEELAKLLKNKINEAVYTKLVKGELLFSLQQILQQHQHLKGTAFQVAINNLIEREIGLHTKYTITEVEIRNLWNS